MHLNILFTIKAKILSCNNSVYVFHLWRIELNGVGFMLTCKVKLLSLKKWSGVYAYMDSLIVANMEKTTKLVMAQQNKIVVSCQQDKQTVSPLPSFSFLTLSLCCQYLLLNELIMIFNVLIMITIVSYFLCKLRCSQHQDSPKSERKYTIACN